MKKIIFVLTFLLIGCGSHLNTPSPAITKKFIELGWDSPTPEFIQKNIKTMEIMPFNGVVYSPLDSEGTFSYNILGISHSMSEMESAASAVRNTKSAKLTDNFLLLSVDANTSFSWFDDSVWNSIILPNFDISAYIASGGSKGFMIDTEAYAYNLWDPNEPGYSSEQIQAQIKLRGIQVIQTINARFQNPVFLFTCAYSCQYGYLPSFLDGLIEGSTSQTKFIDAYEHAYGYKYSAQFLNAATQIRSVSPYRMGVGFGLWLDYFTNTWNPTNPSQNYYSVEEWKVATQSALEYSDEYVWIYTQQMNWWTNTNLSNDYTNALVH